MINCLDNFLIKNFSNFIISLFYIKNFRSLLLNIYSNLVLNINYFDLEKFTTLDLLTSVEYIKIQELGFLPEYFFITILFCLTLFSLFSLKVLDNNKNFLIKFQYNNQLIFLLIFGLACYLILILQQLDVSTLSFISFNDTIHNDQLSFVAKFVISFSSIIYLIFITQYLKSQKLSNFEYYIILFTSIFGFFLLCGANDLITAYLAIELQGLSFYILASFKKSSNFSIESGVKYFVLGSLSTAILLLGNTFIYGFSGSIILTDFKDFFIWVFSANSFFLVFDSILKALEIFQEKTSLYDNFSVTKLQTILDKLDLFKKKFYMLPSEVLLFYPSDWEKVNLREFELCSNISNKMINLSKNIDDFSYFYYEDHNYAYSYSEEFCNHAKKVLSTTSFLCNKIEDDIMSWISGFLNRNDVWMYSLFYDSKDQLVKSVMYESIWDIDVGVLNFYMRAYCDMTSKLGSEKLEVWNNDVVHMKVKNTVSPVYQYHNKWNIGWDDVIFDQDENPNLPELNVYLLDAYTAKVKYMLFDKLYVIYPYFYHNYLDIKLGFMESHSLVFNNQIKLLQQIDANYIPQKNFEDYKNYYNYSVSIINILSLSNFFLELSNMSSLEYYLTFEFSFVIFGFLIIIFAIFFKLALAPFHLWAPDVYEGSPSSSTFFFMIISKFSLFIFLLRLCYLSFYSLIVYWQSYSLIIATISIFIGAVAGLKQRRLKSLLTYSSINNMGFVLLALSTGSFEGIQAKFYYLVIYIISGLCIWAIILNLELKKKNYVSKQNRDLGDLVLLQESNRIVAQNLAIILFTLAGLPPMAGFLAKMSVFKALSGVSIYFFSLINILFSVIATFYYIRIIKIIFFENLLVGKLYNIINTKKIFIINLLTFLLVFLFISPMLPYFYSYKITLFLNKSFY